MNGLINLENLILKTRNSLFFTLLCVIFSVLLIGLSACSSNSNHNDTDALVVKTRADEAYLRQEYAKALELYTKSMDLAWRAEDKGLYYRSMSNIAMIHDVLDDPQRAMLYYKTAFEGAKAIKDTQLMNSLIQAMVVCSINAKNVEEAKKLYAIQQSNPINDSINDIYFLLLNKALILKGEKNFSESVDTLKSLLNFIEKHKISNREKSPILIELGESYSRIHQNDSALVYYQKGLDTASSENLDGYIADACEQLTNMYEREGNLEKAFYYSEKCRVIRDSVFNTQRINNALVDFAGIDRVHTTTTINQLNWKVVVLWSVVTVFGLLIIGFVITLIILRINIKKRKSAYLALVNKIKETENKDRLAQELRNRLIELKNQSDTQNEVEEWENEDYLTEPSDTIDIKTQKLLKRIDDIMNNPDFLFNPDFNLNILSREVGSNTKYVSSAINNFYNLNFRQLLNDLRVKEALKRLVNSDATVQDIAIQLGYGSANNFILAFKSIVGMTPAYYRNLSRHNKK